MSIFRGFDVLIPKSAYLPKWPVIACDQFTSQPEYWQTLRSTIGSAASSLNCILPEAELSENNAEKYNGIRENMSAYLRGSVFDQYTDSFVYVERALLSGAVRTGVVGVIDLEAYDYKPGASCPIRATEDTVIERIPPRREIRRGAPLEMSHVLLLCDDEKKTLIEPLKYEEGTILYDVELLQGGGHVRGKRIFGEAAKRFYARLAEYCERKGSERNGLLFAVGDGNHSLAAAKSCYEWYKQNGADAEKLNRNRFALVELENIYDDALLFEPIHRVVFNVNVQELLAFLKQTKGTGSDCSIKWLTGRENGELILETGDTLPTERLQTALDAYLDGHEGEIDYIHGAKALEQIVGKRDGVGFQLPAVAKEDLFERIARRGVFPRKMFSMGEAAEKRYYLETRRL